MDKITDLKYEHAAANLLHDGLYSFSWDTHEIDKDNLVSIFKDACRLINRGGEHNEEYICAEAVVSSCIRAVRCICLDEEASFTLIHGQPQKLNAISQYENAVRNYEYMKKLKKC